MTDHIKRADAIDACCRGWNNTAEDCIRNIKALPSAEAEWISCSERLPEEGEIVLTQAKFKDDIKMAVSSRVDYNYWTGWHTREINIVAWMPLPKPYRKDSEL